MQSARECRFSSILTLLIAHRTKSLWGSLLDKRCLASLSRARSDVGK
jgi:hypothetical protein